MNLKIGSLIICLIFSFRVSIYAQIYANSLDKIPTTWTKKIFVLSKNYPNKLPENQEQPWKIYDFRTQPLEYIREVKKYVLAGNVEKDWVIQANSIRKWYHAPSMIWGENGREFINGLTRERSSKKSELHPNQTLKWQNWAVGFYNPLGGYTIGQVYKNSSNPDPSKAIFPEGTVAAKLLFSNAPDSQVPYLKNSLTWLANIHVSTEGTNRRDTAQVRLLQLDVAIKDSRFGNPTSWVMITFAYSNYINGSSIWSKLVPVGIQWGNDPNSLTTAQPLTESWINPAYTKLFTFGSWTIHTGYKGRMNGPVDNPNSSCLSCHGTAQNPYISTGMIPDTDSMPSLQLYFRNILPPALFENKPIIVEHSLDYSLQLSVGIPLAKNASNIIHIDNQPPTTFQNKLPSLVKNDKINIKKLRIFLTTRDFENEDSTVIDNNSKSEPIISNTKPESVNLFWLWSIGIVSLILFIILLIKEGDKY